jgi:RNA polymerase sigma-70 factor (ECF subfamily)
MARTPRQIEDERLALRCRLGEPAAFAELVGTTERPLLYFARSIIRDDEAALDVLQAVWMTAFRQIRRLEEPAALRSWLYTVTRGHAVDHFRRDVARASAERMLIKETEEVASPLAPTDSRIRLGGRRMGSWCLRPPRRPRRGVRRTDSMPPGGRLVR